jgi:hypothetical protein
MEEIEYHAQINLVEPLLRCLLRYQDLYRIIYKIESEERIFDLIPFQKLYQLLPLLI